VYHTTTVEDKTAEGIEQLGVAAASMATYTRREKTRLEHQWEIARKVGYRDFADAEAELAVWVDDRAWTTGEGAVAVFNGAVGWLRGRRVLLPAVTTLARLVAASVTLRRCASGPISRSR